RRGRSPHARRSPAYATRMAALVAALGAVQETALGVAPVEQRRGQPCCPNARKGASFRKPHEARGFCRMLRTVAATALFLASSLGLVHAGGARIALVIGVSNYERAASLPNTLNDAKDVSAALKRLGFDVETVLDPSRSSLEAAVRRYGDRSVGAEVGV